MSHPIHTGTVLFMLAAWLLVTLQARGEEAATPGGAGGAGLGQFTGHADVGTVRRPSAVEFSPARQEYRVTAAGENVWAKVDAFHFLWRQLAGDLTMTADVGWVGDGKNAHRKAGWMVRQGLAADAPYADVAVHGDGLISLQYRREAGGITQEVRSPVKGPATVKLERNGDLFTLSVAKPGGAFQPVGSITLALPDPVYAGLMVCSHEADVAETAIFTNVALKNDVLPPGAKRVRQTTLETLTPETGERQIVYRALAHFEAPNWSPDGKLLYFNQQGRIYTLPVSGGGGGGGGTPQLLDTGTCTQCNNDHGLSADGQWLAISHHEQGQSLIYVLASAGGPPRRVTPQGPSYWHGWSPDGKTLVYCAQREGNFDIYAIPAAGGAETRLTTAPGLDDGPEYAPDGRKIYFNSERTGLMKIWRMNPDASQQEQVTTDAQYADWFAHPSPDGRWLVFVSYDASVTGHPESKDVVLRLLPAAGGQPKIIATLFGGQGTLNVPSWSPDSQRLAFVSYRFVVPPANAVAPQAPGLRERN